MATTANFNLWSPDDGDDWDLTIDLAAMMNSVDLALLNNIAKQATTIAGLGSGTTIPQLGWVSNAGAFVIWNGTAWVAPRGQRVATATARNALYPTPVAGDNVYRTDISAEERYNGSAWVSVGTNAIAVVGNNVDQAMSSTAVPVAWQVELVDSEGMHDNAVNNTRLTAKQAGFYEVTFQGYMPAASGVGVAYGRKNGSTNIRSSWTRREGGGTTGTPITTTFSVSLAVNDYIEIMASHSGGGVLGGTGNIESLAGLTIKRIGNV